MGGEDDASAGDDGSEGFPHDAFGRDVHPRGRFVEEEDGRVAHESDGEGEFAFVSAG